MDLTWWPVAVGGLVCLAAVVAVAMLWPTGRSGRRRQPLAHTARLTRLPEYRAVVRRQTRATATALALLVLLFVTTVLATARPTRSVPETTASGPRADIMLCVAQPVADPATGAFLGYFARQARTYGAVRIGLTSPNRRLVPLTRDHQFAAARFGDYAQGDQNPTRTESFTGAVEYDDYAPTVADVLALCITGFPGFENPGDAHRSVIYLGPGALREPGDERASLFTDAQVTEMAQRGGIRIDAVATAGRATDSLATIARSTGGRFLRFDATTLDSQLDEIRAATPDDVDRRRDAPGVALVAGLALAGLLAVSLMAVRR